jgi:HSP20 family molecular chaperone IbpA
MATATPTTSTPSTTAEAAASPASQRALRTLTPPVDIFETDSAFVLLADMPGVTHDTLEVFTELDTLVIRGRAESRTANVDHQEFELGEYRRVFLITEDLDVDAISANLADGVLRVDIPKSERMKPRRIPVKAE